MMSFRQSLKACAVLSPLLGFTWMFGVLTVTDTAGLVFQYFFTILNSLQVIKVARNSISKVTNKTDMPLLLLL